jgi:hypothetical protein
MAAKQVPDEKLFFFALTGLGENPIRGTFHRTFNEPGVLS